MEKGGGCQCGQVWEVRIKRARRERERRQTQVVNMPKVTSQVIVLSGILIVACGVICDWWLDDFRLRLWNWLLFCCWKIFLAIRRQPRISGQVTLL